MILLISTVVIGVFLRVYLISDQILLNDEWHGMLYASMYDSIAFLLTHFNPGATSVPLNIYTNILLHTVGYNEMWLRGPSLIGGMASLIVLPYLIGKIFSRRTTLIFTFLLAISPFLVFYSRVSRPYSLYMLLGFSSILALYIWATQGNRKYLYVYAVSGILAIYFHILAVIPVIAPLGCVILLKLWNKLKSGRGEECALPAMEAMSSAGAAVILISSVLVAPGFLTGGFPTPVGSDEKIHQALPGFLTMLCGTADPTCLFLFFAFLVFGLAAALKKMPLLGCSFVLTALSYSAVLYIMKPASIHASIVLSRYVIPLFPFSLALAAFGSDSLLEFLERKMSPGKRGAIQCLSYLAGAGLLMLLFASGPLIEIYSSPNNFTNHSAFQEKYGHIDWGKSYVPDIAPWHTSIKSDDMPPFYKKIAGEGPLAIIEYPMSLVDQMNQYYYYQRFHKKRVLAGYIATDDQSTILANQLIWLDAYLSIISFDHRKGIFKFRNMVDMQDIRNLKDSGARYIILHRNLIPGEWAMHCNNCAVKMEDISHKVTMLSRLYPQYFGQPVFQDDKLVVFENPPAQK